ncbi:MAG: 3-hydroxyacyl-CoA dehydrogenase/enoyl-CoA hydratase family protein [Planctomycetes bacterium]|nr:3-hydroxyacyl-CoA dehydrogenase/enoyl-CoA hydratase family protein [Planctomycetota bacterium]
MSHQILGRPVTKIGVIGSGQIGPDIALHFSKVFHDSNVPIVIVDISEEALARGSKKLHKKVDRGVETGAFSPAMGQAMKESCTFTTDYEELRGADLIIEAATEDRDLKARIFGQVRELVSDRAVLASNSSHLEPEAIFSDFEDPSRTLVIHYFFPAERNPMVEIVPGAGTSPQLAESLMRFYESIGKAPIQVRSRYGYALDPVFEGQFLAAALLAQDGLGTTKEIDAVACRALGLTVGPFTAMNLTGGNPITHHGLQQYTSKIMPWYHSPKILSDRVASGEPWEVPARGEEVAVPEDRAQQIFDLLRGAYFGIVCEVLDSGISNIADLDMGVELGLDMAAPFRLMNEVGVPRSLELVRAFASRYDGFKISDQLQRQAASGRPWAIPTVLRRDDGDIAVITIRRPKVLNALNEDAFSQIEQHFRDIADDPKIAGAVLTGFGVKAFVSGADVNFLAEIDSKEKGTETSWSSQQSVMVVEKTGKPVVCAMNGFAFGGGNELAMACTARIARKGLKVLAAQPETNLGIIPGAGATQRLPRLVGIEKAAELIRTGRPVSSKEALEIGLISREVDGDVVEAAIELARSAARGQTPLHGIDPKPLRAPNRLPDVDLGHRSRAVDAILCRAILEGVERPLDDGLRFESEMFGEVCGTRDMRIGVMNFIENGPRKPAEFVHE